MTHEKRWTPWGESQTVREIAPGIEFITTASHGGIYLDARRRDQITAAFAFAPFAGGQWYEEDEDWSVVAAFFCEHFPPFDVLQAVRTIRHPCCPGRWGGVQDWLESDRGRTAREMASIGLVAESERMS